MVREVPLNCICQLTINVKDTEVLQKIFDHQIPVESSVVKARQFLSKEHFTCMDKQGYQGVNFKGDNFIACERRDGSVIVFDRWVVVVVHEGDTVKEVNVDENLYDILQ